MCFLASAKDVKGGIAGLIGKEAGFFDDLAAAGSTERNDFVNQLRDEVRAWREAGWPDTTLVTRRLLEWWFDRDEERKALGKRSFFCQQEAVETVIYLYEVKNRSRIPETGDLLRDALKLATGTSKTVVMALIVTWATLHKRKVSASSLSANFLVLVPNLTVRDRVSGQARSADAARSGAARQACGRARARGARPGVCDRALDAWAHWAAHRIAFRHPVQRLAGLAAFGEARMELPAARGSRSKSAGPS